MSSPVDPFIKIEIDGYIITAPIDEGAIGQVYKAEKVGEIQNVRAIKFIAEKNIRAGWQNEINKVTKLRNTDGVVGYHTNGFKEISGQNYLWISWDYIEGLSLKKLIIQRKVTIQILCDVVLRSLEVLHACQGVSIQHADLHAGNIIVENPNPLRLYPEQQKIWITDFGYLSASMGRDQLDDFTGLLVITKSCLASIDFTALESREKIVYNRIQKEFIRLISETDATEGQWVRRASELYRQFDIIAKSETSYISTKAKGVGDYLAAELIGDQYDEWKSLFVPDFIGRDALLEKNTTILTGLRGCGKTMVFRRLTAIYDAKLGPSGVIGADTFIGFYVNCRIVAEAFPWLPSSQEDDARSQVIHFYHVCWCLEILEWLEIEVSRGSTAIDWLGAFFANYFGSKLLITAGGRNLVRHIQSLLNAEIERSRLKGKYTTTGWELSDIRFLEKFADALKLNVTAIQNKPLYLFLDDYSTPLVSTTLQRILNPIVFRRSANIITKIATESVESFEPVGLNGKRLEENDDFTLIDCSVHALTMDKSVNRAHLSAIFQRRIDRVISPKKRKLGLQDILGKTYRHNTELARQLRRETGHKDVQYYGFDAFCDVWSGNMREMISLFAEMLSSGSLDFENHPTIPAAIQDRILRSAGGRYLSLLAAATNPHAKIYEHNAFDRSFGERLVKIAKAFQVIAVHELMTKDSRNQKNKPPKQARKIEITDVTNELPPDIESLYSGILRYGLFIRDYRGKSVRGKAVPRLFLRSILIPYFTLTFSKRDHVTLSWDDFCRLLREPDLFAEYWVNKNAALAKKISEPHLPGL